jgi:hypothetical protein
MLAIDFLSEENERGKCVFHGLHPFCRIMGGLSSDAATFERSAGAKDQGHQGQNHQGKLNMLAVNLPGKEYEGGKCVFHGLHPFLSEVIYAQIIRVSRLQNRLQK